ncbi:MAG: anti-sigma factor antagonist [Planctomycetota bacterium]|nr:anti-sigma factor antagonist [Planctomycetota bacterium]
MVTLLFRSGGQNGKQLRLPLNEGIVFGRDQSCRFRLNSTEVSREHCLITRTAEGLTVQDLESGNGTFVNGTPIKVLTNLVERDQLKIGPFLFEVVPDARSSDSATKRELSDQNVLDMLMNDGEGDNDSSDTTIVRNVVTSEAKYDADSRPSSEFSVKKVSDTLIVRLKSPRLSAYNVHDIVRKLTELIEDQDQKKIVLNLSSVESIFSTGLTHLVDFQKEITNRGGELRLCHLQPVVRDVLEATLMNRMFEFHENERAALDSF